MEEKLAEATVKITVFTLLSVALRLVLLVASIAAAWVFFGWKLALVVFLTEFYCSMEANAQASIDKYADKLEKGMLA